ncbi:jg19092 [Pararge aegeria aegeria]|uniref:Jg19092 protein n=1 Tax=Pararge aegeria aegeria TaxID=348720 RepID=A0A8S4SQP3_9NEOP|nr:jg19092 [Pararge aegeria aegeria]
MDLHLHLSFAFRALDLKWGTPVDLDVLDTSFDSAPCVPAIIDAETSTFSSDEFLKTIRRGQKIRDIGNRRCKPERLDSFANISISRIPSKSDLESVSSDTIGSTRTNSPCSSGYGGSYDNLDDFTEDEPGSRPSGEEFEEYPNNEEKRWRVPKIFKQIKTKTAKFVKRKF